MTKILIIGAGRSATSLIDYLLQHAQSNEWKITVADVNKKLAEEKLNHHPSGTAIEFDIQNESKRKELIREADLVISMLPAFMHGEVARDCVAFGKHMATASYVSAEMKELDAEAQRKNILLLNECGLDPGIDHASAMKIIDQIHSHGGVITEFRSYCGGLVAPESNDNPWGYKFSWNPRNVILAGQGTAQYLENGKIKYIPYNRLFTQTDHIQTEDGTVYDAYANRDSISYVNIYGLNNIKTMLRGTLRQQGYCKAWNVFVKLGWTDDSSRIANASNHTYASLLDAFLPAGNGDLKKRFQDFAGECWDPRTEEMMDYLGLYSEKKINIPEGSPALILQNLLEEKWKLADADRDMIVMQHQFTYSLPDKKDAQRLLSSLVVKGRDQHHTAMAMTVGLPLAITVKNFLQKKINLNGVQIPVRKEIYEPLLNELEEHNIIFKEKIIS